MPLHSLISGYPGWTATSNGQQLSIFEAGPGFLLLNVIPGHIGEVVKALIKKETVTAVYEVYAPNDPLVMITVNDLDKLRDCVQEIRQIPNISGTTLITGLKKWEK